MYVSLQISLYVCVALFVFLLDLVQPCMGFAAQDLHLALAVCRHIIRTLNGGLFAYIS